MRELIYKNAIILAKNRGKAQVIYLTESQQYGVCPITEWDSLPITHDAQAIAWPDGKLEPM